MARTIPYGRVLLAAVAFAAGLACLLDVGLHDWSLAVNLSVVTTFWIITLGLAANALYAAFLAWRRRKGDDPFGFQSDFDLAA